MNACKGATSSSIHIAIDVIVRIAASSRPRSRCHAPDAPTTSAVARYAATTMCVSRYGNDGLKITAIQSVGTMRPSTIA